MSSSNSSVLERVLRPLDGRWPAEFSRQLLTLSFTADEQTRYESLSEKAQLGNLTSAEKLELDDLLTANDLLMILQSKAHRALGQTSAG